MVGSANRPLAIAGTASAAVFDLPVVIKGSYSSVRLDIGTPPKEHQLLFDTSSSTLWTVSTDCTQDSCPERNTELYKRRYYNASASSTAVDVGIPAMIPYLGGNVEGEIYQDVFSALDGSVEWNQSFIAVNESSWVWITADGFLGLGFSTIAELNTSTLDKARFGLYFGTNLGDEGPQDGVLSIGDSHEDKYVDGQVVYAPLQKVNNEYGLWHTPLKAVHLLVAKNPSNPNHTVETHIGKLPTTQFSGNALESPNITLSTFGDGRAVFDTGAGRLSVPYEMIDSLYYNLGWDYQSLLYGKQRFTCEAMNASWAISLILGEGAPENDVVVSIRGDEFLEPGAQCMPPFDSSSSPSFALVGSAFLHRYYTIWDFGADKVAEYMPRLGFGRLKKEFDWNYQS